MQIWCNFGFRLFTSVPDDTWTKPTVAALMALYDNYVPEVATNEDHNAQEQEEEEAFLTAAFATNVTIRAHEFLASKGLSCFFFNSNQQIGAWGRGGAID